MNAETGYEQAIATGNLSGNQPSNLTPHLMSSVIQPSQQKNMMKLS